MLRGLLDRFPDAKRDAGLWNNYGVTLLKSGDTEKAIAALRQALALNPNLKDAQDNLAVATGQKPMPTQPQPPPPPGGLLELQAPTSPTLGPAPLLQR